MVCLLWVHGMEKAHLTGYESVGKCTGVVMPKDIHCLPPTPTHPNLGEKAASHFSEKAILLVLREETCSMSITSFPKYPRWPTLNQLLFFFLDVVSYILSASQHLKVL